MGFRFHAGYGLLFGCGDGWLSARLATIRMLKNPRVRTEADNLFGCYGTLVSTYKGVWRSHARGE
mgnify:CR=1 FL=1